MTAKVLERDRKNCKTKAISSIPNWMLSIRGLFDGISDRRNGKGRVKNMINILNAQKHLRISEYETVHELKINNLKHEIANHKSALERRLSSGSAAAKARAHSDAVAITEIENKINLERDEYLSVVEQVKKNTAVKEAAYLRFVDSKTRIENGISEAKEVGRNEAV